MEVLPDFFKDAGQVCHRVKRTVMKGHQFAGEMPQTRGLRNMRSEHRQTNLNAFMTRREDATVKPDALYRSFKRS